MKRFKGLKIKAKLLTAFIFLAVMGLALGLAGALSIEVLLNVSDELHELQVESFEIVPVICSHYAWRQELTEAVLLDKEFTGTLDPKKCSLGIWMEKAESDARNDGAVIDIIEAIYELHESIHHEAAEIVRLQKNGDTEAAREMLFGSVLPKTAEVIAGLSLMESHYTELSNDKSESNARKGESLSTLIIILIAVALVAGAIMSLTIPSSIVMPLEKLSIAMKEAADGDFTIKLPHKHIGIVGGLYDSCNSLVKLNNDSVTNLHITIRELRETAERMMNLSALMADNSSNLTDQTSSVSSVTEEFSASIGESANSLSTASSHISAVASSIEEINSTINNVAAAAEETSTMVRQSSSLVDSIQDSISKASGSVRQVSNTFSDVAQSVDDINKSIMVVSGHSISAKNQMAEADLKATNTNQIIQRLESASKKIGKIVSMISDIADQTNMLALNAAIEAAGAGEAGKGFMIVANEVKELAKQTADATGEIADHIENMQSNMPEAVAAVIEITAFINGMTEFMNSFALEIEQQGARSDRIADDTAAAAQKMSEISEEISRISENALSVTKTVVESTKGVNEIAKATAELAVGTQEIAMNAERASNNISEINRSAREISGGVNDISRNIQLINTEAGTFRVSADSTKQCSEELLKTANDLEEFISQFKTSGQ